MSVLHRARRTAPGALMPSALMLCAAIYPASSVNASSVPDALRACTQVPDNDTRLACYDREMARLIAQSDSAIGLTPRQERELDVTAAKRNGEAPPPPAPKPQISATITGIVRRSDGRAVITLDNGETWLQGEAYESFNARPGESVHIRSGLLGSFYMRSASGADTRVTRQR